MKVTKNYKLYKPDYDDAVDIEYLNKNTDILDEQIKNIENNVNLQAPVRSVNNYTGDVMLMAEDINLKDRKTSLQEHADKMDAILQGGDKPVKLTIDSPGVVSPGNMSDGIIVLDQIEGNTVNILEKPLVINFAGKIAGSTKENPNIIKHNNLNNNTGLLNPSDFVTEGSNQYYYDKNRLLDGDVSAVIAKASNAIPQQLFSFNVLEEIKRKLGIEWTVEQAKQNIDKITCNWWGYGSCPSGNKAYLTAWFVPTNSWNSSTTQTTINSTTTKLTLTRWNNVDTQLYNFICSNGYIHYIAYTDASNGNTASTIYTDYVELEVTFKTSFYKSLDSCVVKSVGKNLIREDKLYKFSGTNWNIPSDYNGGDYLSGTAFEQNIQLEPNASYTVSFKWKNNKVGESSSNRYLRFQFIDQQGIIFKNAISGLNGYAQNNLSHFSLFTNDTSDEYKFKSFTITTPSTPLILKFVGNENCILKKHSLQLEEGTTATDYEEYKEDKIDILNQLEGDKSLKRLPNGVTDTIDKNGVLTRRIKKNIWVGIENWDFVQTNDNTIYFQLVLIDSNNKGNNKINLIVTNTFPAYSADYIWNNDVEGISINNVNRVGFRIAKSKLSTLDAEGLKKWLSENNTTVYYELAEPVQERIYYGGIQAFKNGNLFVDTSVPTKINILYPTSLPNRVANVEKGLDRALDSIDELFTSASEGKNKIAEAINNKGVPAAPTDTFPTLATKIGQISGGGTIPEECEDCKEGKKLIAAAVTRKGVSASRNDDFPTLANKIDSINTKQDCPVCPPVTGRYITTIGTRVTDGTGMLPIIFDPGLGFDPSLIVVSFQSTIEATVSGGTLELANPTIVWSKAGGIYGGTEYFGNVISRSLVGVKGNIQAEFVGTPTRSQIVISLSTTGSFIPDVRHQFRVTAFE